MRHPKRMFVLGRVRAKPEGLFSASLPLCDESSGTRMRHAKRAMAKAIGDVSCVGAWRQGMKAAVHRSLILALVKRIAQADKAMRAGGWQETLITESLAGKTLGVLGLGRLGKHVARYGQAFGMNVIAWSPHLTDERAAEVSVRRVSKEDLFAQSDIVSLHLVSNAATKGIVGPGEIAAMKPTAYLVNTSRGPLIDEQALIRALQERRIAGAGLDVFWTEPLPKDHVVRRLDNVVLTPHLGYVVDDNLKMFYQNAVKNIKSWIAGEPLAPMGH